MYVGSLPPHYGEKEVHKEFEVFGSIVKLDLKKASNGTGYCFIEYSDPRDARDAIAQMHGRPPVGDKDGAPLRVELPNSRRDGGRGGAGGPPRMGSGAKRGDYVLEVSGLPPSGSWQDLKDHFRVCGDVGYADVWCGSDPDAPKFGEVSFFSRRDMLDALERLDGSTFRSHQNEKTRIAVRPKRSHGMADVADDDRAACRGYGGSSYSRGGGYSRSHRSFSPRGGGDDYYASERGHRRLRSRSRDRSPPPARSRDGYGRGEEALARRYDERSRI